MVTVLYFTSKGWGVLLDKKREQLSTRQNISKKFRPKLFDIYINKKFFHCLLQSSSIGKQLCDHRNFIISQLKRYETYFHANLHLRQKRKTTFPRWFLFNFIYFCTFKGWAASLTGLDESLLCPSVITMRTFAANDRIPQWSQKNSLFANSSARSVRVPPEKKSSQSYLFVLLLLIATGKSCQKNF